MSQTPTNAVDALAHWVVTRHADWSQAARTVARQAFIDVTGCLVAGAREPVTGRTFDAVHSWGAGPASVVGRAAGLAPPWAALVNGAAAHALDFDDTFDPSKGHATAVLAPALMAVGEAEGASEADVLDAYIVGLQVIGRVGQALNPHHRWRGWHSTATIGVVGAAAALARLMGLDRARTAHAIALSTSMAGGFVSQFGSMAKPLHAGLAAKGGVLAAGLARAGVDAGRAVLDGAQGMGTLMVGPDLAALRQALAGRDSFGQTLTFATEAVGDPLLIEAYGLKVKPYPTCASAHRSVDALIALRAEHGFSPEDIERIETRLPLMHLRNLTFPQPESPAEARFSLHYCLAVAAVTGDNTLADFTDQALTRPEVAAVMARTEADGVDLMDTECPAQVTVRLTGGQTVTAAVQHARGSKANPLDEADLMHKLDGCLSGRLDTDRAAALTDRLATFGADRPVAGLMGLLAGA